MKTHLSDEGGGVFESLWELWSSAADPGTHADVCEAADGERRAHCELLQLYDELERASLTMVIY